MHFLFDTKERMANTFLRFQEHYESPVYAGKMFTVDEFKSWYAEKYKSMYESDWSGFNFPGAAYKSFREAAGIDLLTEEERTLSQVFDKLKKKFYVIGTLVTADQETVDHEIAHAMFNMDAQYRTQVRAHIVEMNVSALREDMLEMGYREEVIYDEINAYLATSTESWPFRHGNSGAELRLLFIRYKEKHIWRQKQNWSFLKKTNAEQGGISLRKETKS